MDIYFIEWRFTWASKWQKGLYEVISDGTTSVEEFIGELYNAIAKSRRKNGEDWSDEWYITFNNITKLT